MRTLIALAIMAAAAASFAAPPELSIVGPTGGQPGDILLLDATKSDAEHFDWGVTPKLPEGRPTILPLEGGKKCIVTSVPGNYTVFLAGSNGEGVKLVEWGVKVGGDPTPPTPGPTPPGPQPTPPTPTPPTPSPTGLAAEAVKWTEAVTSPTRVEDAHKLSGAFEAAAAEIVAGQDSQPQQFLQALARHNSAAIPADRRSAWAPFEQAFVAKVNELYKGGKLSSRDAWATMFREISVGLAAVK